MGIHVPDDLVTEIKGSELSKCIVFVGAGLSQGAGLPGWRELLHMMICWAEDHGVDIPDRAKLECHIDEGKLLMVAEEMRRRLRKDDFRRFMVEKFRKPISELTEAHKLIPKIPFAAALTTNYDKLLESAYTLVHRGVAPHVFTHSDRSEVSAAACSEEFYVFKVHGTIDRIDTIILGSTDFDKLMDSESPYQYLLTLIFSTKTILFLGFRLEDPDLRQLLDRLRRVFKDYTRKHYALMNTEDLSSIEQNNFERLYNIEIIPYVPSASDHPEVRDFLEELARKTV